MQRVLADESGRTRRGSLGNIRSFLTFLNRVNAQSPVNSDSAESWWADPAKQVVNAKPFALHCEAGKLLRSVIRDSDPSLNFPRG